MFQENLKTLRKNKGVTQEELAARLCVVRQTVSKWEKGYSVPDAEQLSKIADFFDVPISMLLGGQIEQESAPTYVGEQLSRINEQLVIKNRRSKRIWTVIAVITGITLLLMMLSFSA